LFVVPSIMSLSVVETKSRFVTALLREIIPTGMLRRAEFIRISMTGLYVVATLISYSTRILVPLSPTGGSINIDINNF
jgi:hypothetical protein